MDGSARSVSISTAVAPSVSVINISGGPRSDPAPVPDAARLGWLMSGARDPVAAASVAAVLGLSPAAAVAALHGTAIPPGPMIHATRPLAPGMAPLVPAVSFGRAPVNTLVSPPPAHSNRRDSGPPLLRPLAVPPALLQRQQQQRLLEAELRQLAEMEASEMASFEAAEAEQEERGSQATPQLFHGIQLPPELQITVVAPATSHQPAAPSIQAAVKTPGRRPPPQLTPLSTAPELVRTAGVWRPTASSRELLVPSMANRSRTPLATGGAVSVPLYRGSGEVSVTVLPSAALQTRPQQLPLRAPRPGPARPRPLAPARPLHLPAPQPASTILSQPVPPPASLSALLAAPTVLNTPLARSTVTPTVLNTPIVRGAPTFLTTPVPRSMSTSTVLATPAPRNMVTPISKSMVTPTILTTPISRSIVTPTVVTTTASRHMITPTVMATPIPRPATTQTVIPPPMPRSLVSTSLTSPISRSVNISCVKSPVSSLERQPSMPTLPVSASSSLLLANQLTLTSSRPCLPVSVAVTEVSPAVSQYPAVSESAAPSVHPLLGSLVRKVVATSAAPAAAAAVRAAATSTSSVSPVSSVSTSTSTVVSTPVSPPADSQSVPSLPRRKKERQQQQQARRRSEEVLAGGDSVPSSPPARVVTPVNGALPKIPTLRITKNKTGDEYSVQSASSGGVPQAKSAELFYTFDAEESAGLRQMGCDQRPRYVCDICQAVYQRLHSLKRHRYRTHINHQYVHQSDMASAELTALLDTSQFARMTPLQPDSRYPFLYCCYQCRQLYDSLDAVVEHQHAVHGAAPLPGDAGPRARWACDRCDDTFASRRELDKHAEVHECQSFACKFCDQVFPCESVKKRHEKIHSRDGGRSGMPGQGPAGGVGQQAIAKINIGGVKISVGIGNLQQLKKFQEACREMSETSNGTISLESADLDVLEQLEERPRAVFPCALCDKSFPSYKRMCCHMRMAHPQRPVPSKASCFQRGGAASAGGDEQGEQQRNMHERRFYAAVADNVADNMSRHLDGTLHNIRHQTTDNSNGQAGLQRQPETAEAQLKSEVAGAQVKPENAESESKPDVVESEMKPEIAASEPGGARERSSGSDWRRVDLQRHLLDLASQARQASLSRQHHQPDQGLCSQPDQLPGLLGLRASKRSLSRSEDGVRKRRQRAWWLPAEAGPAARYSEPACEGWTAPLGGESHLGNTLVCHACGAAFSSLSHLQDHQLQRHPHVVCGHTRLSCPPPAPLTLAFTPSMPGSGSGRPGGQCSQCARVCASQAELHRHVLECAGHLDWNQWASSSGSPRKRRWRAFGARRRRRLAPALRRHLGSAEGVGGASVKKRRDKSARTKHSRDTASDSIEKMLANLPAKRVAKQLFPVLNLVQLQRRHKQQQQQGSSRAASRTVSPCVDTPSDDDEDEREETGAGSGVESASTSPAPQSPEQQDDSTAAEQRDPPTRPGRGRVVGRRRGRRLLRVTTADLSQRRGRPAGIRGRPRGRPPISRLPRNSDNSAQTAAGGKRSRSSCSPGAEEGRPASRLKSRDLESSDGRHSPSTRPGRKRLSRTSRPQEQQHEEEEREDSPAIPANSMFSVSMTTNRTRTAYTCTKCCQKLYRLATLERHLQKCCDQPDFSLQSLLPAEITEQQCSLCSHGFLSNTHLALHVAACHRHAAISPLNHTEQDQYDMAADENTSGTTAMDIAMQSSNDKSPATDRGEKSPVIDIGAESLGTDRFEKSPGTGGGDKSPVKDRDEELLRTDEGDKTPGSIEGDKSLGTGGGDESPGADRGDKTPGTNEGGKSPGADRADKTPGTNAGGKSPGADRGDKTRGSIEGDKSLGTGGGDESPGVDKSDESAIKNGGDKSPGTDGVQESPDCVSVKSAVVSVSEGVDGSGSRGVGGSGSVGRLPGVDDASRIPDANPTAGDSSVSALDAARTEVVSCDSSSALVSSSTDRQPSQIRCSRCERPFLSARRLARHQGAARCSTDWRRGDGVTRREVLFSLLHGVRREADAGCQPDTDDQYCSLTGDVLQQQLLSSIADKLSDCTAEQPDSQHTEEDRRRFLRGRLCERVLAAAASCRESSAEDRCPASDNVDSLLLGLQQLVANDDVLRFLREAPSRCRRQTQLVAGLGLAGSVGRGCTARQWASESAGLRVPRRPPQLVPHGRQRPSSVIENMRSSFNAGKTVARLSPPRRTEEPAEQIPQSEETSVSTGQLGVIASAVNCVLDVSSQSSVPSRSLSPTPSVPRIDADVQQAMGITDEQLEVLERLGSCRQSDLVYDNMASDPAPGLLSAGPPGSGNLADEQKRAEFECFICDRRYCGREALQQHLLKQHRASRDKVLTRTSQLSAAQVLSESECVERCCFVCGELMSDSLQLNLHIAQLHIRRPEQPQSSAENQLSAGESRAAGDESNQLRRQMNTALGGLFDKAICSLKKQQRRDKQGVVSTSCLSPVTTGCSSSDGCGESSVPCENGSESAELESASVSSITAPVLILCPLCYEPVSLHDSGWSLREHLSSRHGEFSLQFSASLGRQARFFCSARGQTSCFSRPLIQSAGGMLEPVTCTAVSSTQLTDTNPHSGFICSGCGVCFDNSSEAYSHERCADEQPLQSTSGVCVSESVVACLYRQLDASCSKSADSERCVEQQLQQFEA